MGEHKICPECGTRLVNSLLVTYCPNKDCDFAEDSPRY